MIYYDWTEKALKIIAQHHIQLDVSTPAMQNQDWIHIHAHG